MKSEIENASTKSENVGNLVLEKELTSKKHNKASKILLIIGIILMAITTFILGYMYVDVVFFSKDQSSRGLGLVFYIVFGLVIYGGIGYGLSLLLNVIAMIIQLVKKGEKRLYIIMAILPIALELLFYLLVKIV